MKGFSDAPMGNAVEFDHHGWQEICIAPDGKNVECIPLAKASPR
jgi:hypothetical protein